MRQLLVIPALLLAACGAGASFAGGSDNDGPVIAPQGSGGARSYAASGFSEIGIAGPDSATVQVGPAFSLRVEGDPAVLDRLEVRLRGDRLSLGRKREWRETSRGSARYTITLPRLTTVAVAGSGNMSVDRAQAESFKASVAGSGKLALNGLRTDALKASVAGSGDVTGNGSAGKLDLSIAGSGNIDAPELTAASAAVSIAGSGSVRARVTGAATVKIAGSGDVDLGPQAQCKVSKAGAGRVRCA